MSFISLKTSMIGATAICLSMAITHPSKADATSCPSPIPLGLTTALTGNLALLGTQARNGVELAVDEIKAGGGIGGKKLALDVKDDQLTPATAATAARTLVNSGDKLILGMQR